MAIFAPPLAVLFCGKPFQACLCGILCIFGWLPGMIHAIMVVNDCKSNQRADYAAAVQAHQGAMNRNLQRQVANAQLTQAQARQRKTVEGNSLKLVKNQPMSGCRQQSEGWLFLLTRGLARLRQQSMRPLQSLHCSCPIGCGEHA